MSWAEVKIQFLPNELNFSWHPKFTEITQLNCELQLTLWLPIQLCLEGNSITPCRGCANLLHSWELENLEELFDMTLCHSRALSIASTHCVRVYRDKRIHCQVCRVRPRCLRTLSRITHTNLIGVMDKNKLVLSIQKLGGSGPHCDWGLWHRMMFLEWNEQKTSLYQSLVQRAALSDEKWHWAQNGLRVYLGQTLTLPEWPAFLEVEICKA